jgi:HK97 family phage portal protein
MAFWNRTKVVESEEEVLEPVFGAAGGMPRQQIGNRVSGSDLLKRYGMMVHRCVTIKSQTAASVPMRLFALGNPKQMSKAHAIRSQEIDAETSAFLRGRMSVAPAAKARSKLRGNMERLVEITEHPLLDLLSDVNPYTEGFGWRESLYADLDIFGRSYHALVRQYPNKPPTSIWRMQAQDVKVLPSVETFVKGFEYGSGTDKKVFDPDDVLWFRTYDPFDPLGGFGPLEAWLQTVDAEFHHAAFVDWIYQRGGSPDYVVTAKNGMSVEQRKAFRSDWRKMFGRLFNRKENVAILSGDGAITALGRAPKELESVEQDAALRDKIAVAFGVPKSLITSDDVNLANAREGSITFMRNSIWPMVQRVEDTLNEHLVPLWSDRLMLVHDNPVADDRKIVMEERQSMLTSGYTVDDIRAMEGRQLLGTPDAETPMVRTDVMPLELVAGGVSPQPQPQAEQLAVEAPVTKQASEQGYISQKAVLMGEADLGCCTHGQWAKAFDPANTPTEFVDAIEGVFKKITKEVIGSVRALKSGRGRTKQGMTVVFNESHIASILSREQIDDWADDLATASTAHVTGLMELAGKESMRTATLAAGVEYGGEAAVFNIQNTRSADWIARQTKRIGTGCTATHTGEIRTIMERGAREGMSPAQMAAEMRAIEKAGKGVFSRYQAERIARTEAAFASTQGQIEGWRQSGVVEGMKFVTASAPCPYCDAVQSQYENIPIPLPTQGSPWLEKGTVISPEGVAPMRLDYSALDGPPIHPNCLCAISPVVVR